ncbi:hypothetical protein H6P81_007214 [Aristolochia fimbriata]|uniref:Retrovirus-related Pol polyprotein from transposon TNT 1-94-like beta-barrel domain-containing protein n=1 Tax=Aristolochia fimbriata TaxID=158543 RepID=A0AAV7EZI4_ARIFI|nr:hypothetical protein H6P81_007214 [Aristolochia fimbriata]
MATYHKEGASNTRPPLLDGTNYAYWKAKMKIYIKAQDERAWRSVEDGWIPPTAEVGEGPDKKRVLKPISEWNDEEDKLSNCNSKALNAIFGGIDEEQFRRVSACTTAKEAWKILEVRYEGTESEIDTPTITLTKLDAKVSLLAKGLNKFIRKSEKKNYSLGEVQEKIQDLTIAPDDETDDENDIGTVENIIKQWDGVLESTKVLREKVGALEREKVVLKQKLDEKEAEARKTESKESLLRKQICVLDEENQVIKQKMNEKEERILKMKEELRKAKEIWVKFDKGKQQLDDIMTQEKRRLQRFWRRNGSRKGVKSTAQNLVWVKKEIGLFAAHIARKSNIDGIWYFDSGCSRHITGSTEFLTNLHKENGGQVTFGDGAKGSVVGRGDLNVQGLPKLKNVLLVDGLKANLISISQRCDQNLYVKFTKDGYQVMDDKHISILEGTRTATSVDTPEVTLVELSIEESSEDMEVSYMETQESASAKEKASSIRVQKNHPADAIIGNVNEGMKTRGKKKNYGDMVKFVCYTSLVEPKKVEMALKDEF